MARASLRSPVAIAILLIAAYVLVLLGLAIFYLHPPLVGWLGLLAVGVAASLLSLAAATVYPRLRTNAPHVHAHGEGVYRLLVVSDALADPDALGLAVLARTAGRPSEVRVVAPVVTGPLHFLAGDEDEERARAGGRLHAALDALAAVGVEAEGTVGDDDPLEAAADELALFHADELLFVGALEHRRGFGDRDFERQARDVFGLPCATVFGDPDR